MPSVKFRREDFLGKTPITPGWYPFTVGEFTEKAASNGESTNFWGEFKVAQDGDFKDTVIRHCFNEKAIEYSGGAADYMACFTSETDKLVGMEVLDMLKQTTGHVVLGYAEWNPQFRRNQINDWRSSK